MSVRGGSEKYRLRLADFTHSSNLVSRAYSSVQCYFSITDDFKLDFCLFVFCQRLDSKKCWVKYNPELGKIWTNPVIGLFLPSGWITQKAGLNITQLLVENNPACVLSNIYPALGCI